MLRVRRKRMLAGRRPPPGRIPPPNRVLAALGDRDCERLLPELQLVTLRGRHVLQHPHEPVEAVFFPNGGVVSILNVLEDGRTIEVATVGSEGLVGVEAFFDHRQPSIGHVVQVTSGTAERMRADRFREHLQRRDRLFDAVSGYARDFTTQLVQVAACNGLHTVTERCSRWLLMAHDRIGHDEFRLTQEFLSRILGVRRPTVTEVVDDLSRRGAIRMRAQRVRILRRKPLEAAACECYEVLRLDRDGRRR